VGGLLIFSSLSLVIVTIFGFEANSREYIYIMQSIGSFGIYFLPALLFSYCASKQWFTYSTKQLVSYQMVGYVVVLSLFLLPVIAYLGYINEQMVLPKFLHNMETWMQEVEEANKIITQKLTENSTI
jgi:hypothetical protein